MKRTRRSRSPSPSPSRSRRFRRSRSRSPPSSSRSRSLSRSPPLSPYYLRSPSPRSRDGTFFTHYKVVIVDMDSIGEKISLLLRFQEIANKTIHDVFINMLVLHTKEIDKITCPCGNTTYNTTNKTHINFKKVENIPFAVGYYACKKEMLTATDHPLTIISENLNISDIETFTGGFAIKFVRSDLKSLQSTFFPGSKFSDERGGVVPILDKEDCLLAAYKKVHGWLFNMHKSNLPKTTESFEKSTRHILEVKQSFDVELLIDYLNELKVLKVCSSCEKLMFPDEQPIDAAKNVDKLPNLSEETREMVRKVVNWIASLPSQHRSKNLVSLSKSLENLAIVRTILSAKSILDMLQRKRLIKVNADQTIEYLLDK